MTRREGGAARRPVVAASGWALEVVAWTLLAWGVWLVTLSAVSTEDLGVGGGSALVCGVATAAIRRVVHGRWRPTLRMVAPAALLPLAVVVDSVSVLSAPWGRGRREGHLASVDIGATGSSPAVRARRALATLVVSATPGTIVLDADADSGCLVVHSFADAGPSMAERFSGT